MPPTFIFFGSSEFSTIVLAKLLSHNLRPSLIVTTPDKPKGRKLILTPSPVKVMAETLNIPSIQPEILDDNFLESIRPYTTGVTWDFFVLASYGKIIPQSIISIPRKGILNVHPSLLPKYRGASPIQSQILSDDKNTGVSIMLMDEKMDHGPLLLQKTYTPETWPPHAHELHDTLASIGGELLVQSITPYLAGELLPKDQNHAEATYCKKITKTDGEISLTDDAYKNFLKIRALEGWPGTYFFIEKNGARIRVKIVSAEYRDGTLSIMRVIPEGKKEMDYQTFLAS